MAVTTNRPDPTVQRKAAIAAGAVADHAGAVRIDPIPNFDLNKTIFQTLEGTAERFIMKTRVARSVHWSDSAKAEINAAYAALDQRRDLPVISQGLLQFMVEECNFDVEHADGSFLDHLYFCYEYAVEHYPGPSPLISFLHSILGTGTNTFAMEAHKIPQLRAFLTDEEWTHIEAFPTVLRLLYDPRLRTELRANLHRLDHLEGLDAFRVIDNQPFSLTASELWVALNLQLLHLVDFLPVANWSAHRNDTSFVVFRDLYDLLDAAGRREVRIGYTPARGPKRLVGENTGAAGWLTTRIPTRITAQKAAQSVRKFSARCGHELAYSLRWSDPA